MNGLIFNRHNVRTRLGGKYSGSHTFQNFYVKTRGQKGSYLQLPTRLLVLVGACRRVPGVNSRATSVGQVLVRLSIVNTFSSNRRLLSSTNRRVHEEGITYKRTNVRGVRHGDGTLTKVRHVIRSTIRHNRRYTTLLMFALVRQAGFQIRQVQREQGTILNTTWDAARVVHRHRSRHQTLYDL